MSTPNSDQSRVKIHFFLGLLALSVQEIAIWLSLNLLSLEWNVLEAPKKTNLKWILNLPFFSSIHEIKKFRRLFFSVLCKFKFKTYPYSTVIFSIRLKPHKRNYYMLSGSNKTKMNLLLLLLLKYKLALYSQYLHQQMNYIIFLDK